MKKPLFISSLFCMVMFSCKKEYSCNCEYNFTINTTDSDGTDYEFGYEGVLNESGKQRNNKEAESWCEAEVENTIEDFTDGQTVTTKEKNCTVTKL